MGRIDQNLRDMSFVAQRHESAQARWAIQIGTVDSLKWKDYHKLSKFLGRNTIEHSFTRLAKIWCDKNGKPLKDPDTGTLYPPILVRGELNPGAIDPNTGDWVGLRIDPHTVKDVFSFIPERILDRFNLTVFAPEKLQAPKCKIAIIPQYGNNIRPFDADYIVEEPVMIGDEETMEAMWLLYQRRAARINAQEHDYDLVRRNCHTVNAALNRTNMDAVNTFANRGFMRWGAKPEAIHIPEETMPVRRPLHLIQRLNTEFDNYLYHSTMARIQKKQKCPSNLQQNATEIAPT